MRTCRWRGSAANDIVIWESDRCLSEHQMPIANVYDFTRRAGVPMRRVRFVYGGNPIADDTTPGRGQRRAYHGRAPLGAQPGCRG
jgi:hypothetical protein